MIKANKRKLHWIFVLAGCVLISVAATKPAASISNKISLADTGLFKNLKVLPKDISKEDLDKVMHDFTAALGVRCNFCHSPGADGRMDFASDAKPEKDIARYMLNMTKEINVKYFNSENSSMPDTISVVKCLTCHRGGAHPEDAIMPDNHGNMPPPPPPPPPGSDSAGKMTPPPTPDSTERRRLRLLIINQTSNYKN